MIHKALIFFLVIYSFFSISLYSQFVEDSSKKEKERILEDWLADLYELESYISKDSFVVSEETNRLITDEDYRQLMYPEIYTWEIALYLISKSELKKAFWYFINLYMINDQNKELVLRSVLAYDKFFKMDKIMINSFYTYIFMDPKIAVIVNGKPEITAPHIMDDKLNGVNELVSFILKFREKNVDSRQNE